MSGQSGAVCSARLLDNRVHGGRGSCERTSRLSQGSLEQFALLGYWITEFMVAGGPVRELVDYLRAVWSSLLC